MAGTNMNYPRGEVLAKTQRPGEEFLALGDSFSAGISVEPHEAGTTTPNVNECHRSELAYPNLISGEGDVPTLGSNGFRACSGAVTTNVTDLAQWNEGIQLDWWPDTTTQVVTMTIGGNDIGFAGFGSACFFSTCQVGSTAYNDTITKLNALQGKLEATYSKTLAYAPNADIYIVGYPHVVGNKGAGDPFDFDCFYMHNSGPNNTGSPHYPWEDAWAARDIVTKLNQEITDAITAVNNPRLHFVNANGTNSPFTGNEVCGTSSTSYFQNVDEGATNVAYVFHPNALGQEAYAELVEDAINAGQ
jgi:lysophospholipase L1-like esterase